MGNCAHYEPTIDEILAEPAVRALMLADGVSPGRLREKLMRLGAARGDDAPVPPSIAGIRPPEAAARAGCF